MRRDLVLDIRAEDKDFERPVKSAAASASVFERELAKLEARQARVDRAMTGLGRGMLVAGAAIAAGLALSVRAAIDWESSWAGVLKTVEGTDAQMAALEEDIRDLTGVLPASHREIAAVAEAAGQLGIQRENVAAFTRTMIDMGEATNLTSDEAATSLARLMNIMQTAPENVSRLASAIVDLGNKGATTESEITEMALRIAGAGNTIGLTEDQVVGFAAALSNVGIRAEAGGTAISRVFLEIDSSVRRGGDRLEIFAETAGVTAAEFRQAYQVDAGGAIASFIAGLGRVQTSGGDVNAVLDQLGLTNIRVSDALRRLSGSGDNLTRTLRIGSQAWDENTALAEEAERRYGTTAAQLRIARNQVNDFAIDMGNNFLPVLGEAADKLAGIAGVIGDLPQPVKAALAVLALAAAAITLTGGAALVAVPKVLAFKAALDTVQNSGGRAATAVGLFRRVTAAVPLGPLAAALGVATVAFGIFAAKQAEGKQRIEEVSETLDQQTGAVTHNTRAWVANDLDKRGILERAEQLGLDLATVTDAVLGEEVAVQELNAALEQGAMATLDIDSAVREYAASLREQGLTQLDVAAKTAQYEAELEGQARAARDVRGAYQGLTDDLDEAGESTRRQAEAMGESGDAMDALDPQARNLATTFGVTAEEAEGLTAGVDDLDKALKGLFDIMFSVEEAQDATAEAMRRLVEAAKEGGTALDGNSKAALDNRGNVRDLISADMDLITAMADAGAGAEDLQTETERLRQKFVDQMRQAGFSEEAIERYAEAYDLIPSEVATRIQTPGMSRAEQNARNLRLAIDRIPAYKRVNIDIHQSYIAPVGSQRIAFQHGGEVRGPAGPDQVPVMATAGEIMIRRPVAQQNRAALLALNATGRWPVGGAAAPAASAEPAAALLTRAIQQERAPLVIRVESGPSELDRAIATIVARGVRNNPAFRAVMRVPE
jgi:TP901 family phage tail tape measure protein